MDLSNNQIRLLTRFKSFLHHEKDKVDRLLKEKKGNVFLEVDLKSEFFGLEDYLPSIIDQFLLDNYSYRILKAEDGTFLNLKIDFDFQYELGFIKVLVTFIN